MKHKKIKEYLQLYQDGNLDAENYKMIQDHLQVCESCRSSLDLIEELWKKERNGISAPNHQWVKIQNRIESNSQIKNESVNPISNLVFAFQSFAYIFLVIIFIFGGHFLAKNLLLNNSNKKDADLHNKIVQYYFLDRLEPIPPESIGKNALYSYNMEGEVK